MDASIEVEVNIWSILSLDGVPRGLKMAAMVGIGSAVGLGVYVVHISRATSYLSDDPATCVNCHVMNPQFASWQTSSHAKVATCNDCHVPHDSTLAKYAYKAKDGLRHSTIFTLRKEPQVIRATAEAQHVIQHNCLRCHTSVVEEVRRSAMHQTDRSCIECHREVPHGRTHSLSSAPNAGVPRLPQAGIKNFVSPKDKEQSQ